MFLSVIAATLIKETLSRLAGPTEWIVYGDSASLFRQDENDTGVRFVFPSCPFPPRRRGSRPIELRWPVDPILDPRLRKKHHHGHLTQTQSLSKHEEGATHPRHSQVHAAAQMG